MERPVSATILVIDDDPLLRTLVRDTLRPDGFSVLEAADGAAGVTQACRRQPDVILLDAIMPGLDGYATCERLKADPATQPIPVIFVTSSQDRALNRRAYALGALACIPKPFRREPVVAMIQMALASRARPAPKA